MRRWRTPLLLALGVGAALLVFSKSRFAAWPFGPKWVRVVRSGGEPVMNAVVVLRRPGGSEPDFQKTTPWSGWLDIPRDVLRSGQEMLVIAAGCGIVSGRLPLLYEVELPPPVPVTLRLAGDFALPAPPRSLSLTLEPLDAPHHLAFALQNAVAPSDHWARDWMERDPYPQFDIDPDTRSVDILVPCPGAWQVRWSVQVVERHGTGVLRSGSGSSERIPIEIPERGGTVLFWIDPAEIARHAPR